MPYDSIATLPTSVRESLPKRAQQIYRRVFNRAWQEYADPRHRRGGASREETAHKVAWAAVKESYEKRGGRWVVKARAPAGGSS
jgi:cation transport regulator